MHGCQLIFKYDQLFIDNKEFGIQFVSTNIEISVKEFELTLIFAFAITFHAEGYW
ncbi:hypothetical protein GCM10023173_20990 [Sphingobacterium thermophilum]|uniref:Uncharacterized protein n=1 Tax=Sphingobacterium thermophilum TaxID=768534 RepID=A0ABP8R6P5_9SPHI